MLIFGTQITKLNHGPIRNKSELELYIWFQILINECSHASPSHRYIYML